jgi:isopenicillin-N N-acyltransferase-like protein
MTSGGAAPLDVVELPPSSPGERGRRLGSERGAEIAATLERYRALFTAIATRPVDLGRSGGEAMASIAGWAPALAEEIEGIASGAGLPVEEIAALNARTEVLAAIGAPTGRGECSTIVVLGDGDGPPLSIQNWDWHEELASSFHVLVVRHPSGRVVRTLTEYGIVGKIGVTSTGLGLHFNILSHERDGGPIGVPVHVIARRILDEANDLAGALALAATAAPSASSAITLVAADGDDRMAVTAEVHPGGPRYVLPNRDGVLLRTNHFLDPVASAGDRMAITGPDSYVRYALLERAIDGGSDAEAARRVLASRFGGASAICSRPAPDARLGERWATLATIELDVAAGTLTVRRGGADEPVEAILGPDDA